MLNCKLTAACTGLKVKVVALLHKANMISDPPTAEEITALKWLAKHWGSEVLIKSMLAGKSRSRRARILLTGGLGKVESFILVRYLDALLSGTRVQFLQVCQEAHEFYKIPLNDTLKHMVRQMRSKAYRIYRNPDEITRALSDDPRIQRKQRRKDDAARAKERERQARQNDIFGY